MDESAPDPSSAETSFNSLWPRRISSISEKNSLSYPAPPNPNNTKLKLVCNKNRVSKKNVQNKLGADGCGFFYWLYSPNLVWCAHHLLHLLLVIEIITGGFCFWQKHGKDRLRGNIFRLNVLWFCRILAILEFSSPWAVATFNPQSWHCHHEILISWPVKGAF